MRSRSFAGLVLLLLATRCAHAPPPAPRSPLDDLTDWMTGSFSSARQSAADPYFRLIRLHAVPLWTDRKNERWLYVEQAMAINEDRPYRQRLYRLTQRRDGAIESALFTLPGDPRNYAGAWQHPEQFAQLSPKDLTILEGCSVVLRKRADGAFEGRTSGKRCASDLRGATYSTSEVVVTATSFVTWDRGYDAKDQQVWGSTKGGYVFEREGSEP